MGKSFLNDPITWGYSPILCTVECYLGLSKYARNVEGLYFSCIFYSSISEYIKINQPVLLIHVFIKTMKSNVAEFICSLIQTI